MWFSILFTSVFFIRCGKQKHKEVPIVDSTSINPPVKAEPPSLTGKLLYHTYENYGDESKMYIYDFSKKQLNCISCSWNLHDPMNGHFNPDGNLVVFMAQSVPDGKWDIYLYNVDSAIVPINLTASDGSRDEDPKFSPDGKNICFKKTTSNTTGNLEIMTLNGTVINHVTKNTIESGMPYYLSNGSGFIYARGAGTTSDIYLVNKDGSNNHAIEKEKDLQEYYPIVIDSASYLFSRWYSASNRNDQIFIGYFSGAPVVPLLFNTINANYSDAFPCGKDYVFVSSTRHGSTGAYDLYIGNIKTGGISSLSSYDTNINTTANELGACYSDN